MRETQSTTQRSAFNPLLAAPFVAFWRTPRLSHHTRELGFANDQRFAAVVMRIREPKTTALIFASGKMVVTGAKSEDDSRLASRKYARIIQKLGFDAKFAEFKIQNIVGSCDVKFPIRLEGLAYSHGAFSSYEPEVGDVLSTIVVADLSSSLVSFIA